MARRAATAHGSGVLDPRKLPDEMVSVNPPADWPVPPVPAPDGFAFEENMWGRVQRDVHWTAHRRAWLAEHAPTVTSRQLYAERRRRFPALPGSGSVAAPMTATGVHG